MKYDFLVETYETERIKVVSAWGEFKDDDELWPTASHHAVRAPQRGNPGAQARGRAGRPRRVRGFDEGKRGAGTRSGPRKTGQGSLN